MSGLYQLRLWLCEFMIRQAITCMPHKEATIWGCYYNRASRDVWRGVN